MGSPSIATAAHAELGKPAPPLLEDHCADGATALLHALRAPNEHAVAMLVEMGANLAARDFLGWNAMACHPKGQCCCCHHQHSCQWG